MEKVEEQVEVKVAVGKVNNTKFAHILRGTCTCGSDRHIDVVRTETPNIRNDTRVYVYTRRILYYPYFLDNYTRYCSTLDPCR